MVAPREGACIHDRIHISFLLHILRVGRSVGLYYIYYYPLVCLHITRSQPKSDIHHYVRFQCILGAPFSKHNGCVSVFFLLCSISEHI